MLKFGNKEFRNLQEQVFKNMSDIANLKSSGLILDEFGIKVVGQESSLSNMPTVADYKLSNPEWAYGDAYAIGTEPPYTLYILTREDANHTDDYWFNIGRFPEPGPQGPKGETGDIGPQGQTGPSGANGAAAGFGLIDGTAQTIAYGSDATVQITTSGPDTAKNIQFTFGIPEGKPGEDGTDAIWGNITGDISNQTDLVSSLQTKQNLLVSGTNIKTINNQSILGSGNIDIQSGGGDVTDVKVNGTSVVNSGIAQITVPTKTSDLTNNSGFITGITSSDVTNALGYTPGSSNFSGDYADLTGKPTIPTKTSQLNNDSGFITSSALSGYATESYVQGYHDSTKQNVISDLSTIRSGAALGATAVQPDDLATVATTGNYTDLIHTPYIPTQTSDLINNSGFITSEALNGYLKADQDVEITGNWLFSQSVYIEELNLTSLNIDNIQLGKTYIAGSTGAEKNLILPSSSGTIALTSDIPSTANFVTTNTSQSITGDKSFSGNLDLEGPVKIQNKLVTDLSHNYGLVIPSTADFTQNRQIATIQDFTVADVVTESEWTFDGSNVQLNGGSLVLDNNANIKSKFIDNYGLVLPNTASFTNNKIIATTDDIPTDVSQLHNDAGYLTDITSLMVTRALGYTPGTSNFSGAYADLTGKPDLSIYVQSVNLATVATTGSYDDLTEKPTIPTVPTNVSAFTNDAGYQTANDVETTLTQKGYQTASDVSTAISGKLDATKCTYQTTAPTAEITDGGVHIVYLSAEPTTKYAGYIYMIAES